MNNLIVLYAEVMPYNVVAFEAFVDKYEDYNLHVFCWDENKKLTPYKQPLHKSIFYYNELEFDYFQLKNKIEELNPKLILISGRMEKKYLKIALWAKKNNIITVSNSDNQYLGTLKNRIAKIFSYFLYRRYFNYMQVPGKNQIDFCLKMGFKREQIFIPQCTANCSLFLQNDYEKNSKEYILFLGRLENVKGIELLIQTHKELYSVNKIKDKLMVIGNGSLKDELDLNYDGIEYFSFMNQEDLIVYLKKVKYFILPSNFEPWGVVVHEMAAAGLPLLITEATGAASTFVENGGNGFIYKENSKSELSKFLIKFNSFSEKDLINMSHKSREMSFQIEPDMWGESLLKLIK